jgi:hypothetical protein
MVCGAVSRGSYCRRHDPAPGQYKAKRGSGWAQSTFRTAVLRRSGGRCERCGSTDRVEAHHRRGVAAGGTHDPRNGEALCWSCHRGG